MDRVIRSINTKFYYNGSFNMNVSVVIPTYGRGRKLIDTLEAILACDSNGLGGVEVIVVDDGSPSPAGPVVASCSVRSQFSLRCIRQVNAGPAKARNTGYRASSGDIVLFMDDDIIAPPELLRQHAEAHLARPGSVVFGRCPFVEPSTPSRLFRHIQPTQLAPHQGDLSKSFVPTSIVASGQLSVERAIFNNGEGVYCDSLETPAAEEFELSYRLQRRGVPILFAPWIVAIHDHTVSLDMVCRQQYKHAVGCAEAALKYPGTLELAELQGVLSANGPICLNDSVRQIVKKLFKRLATGPTGRLCLSRLARLGETVCPIPVVLAQLYTAAISAHFCGGVRDGLRKYSRFAVTGCL